ncbi:MAG: SusF/SusE family outer membrane protein [Chitinophagaceae bacterium]|nr:SusF/SusE family outer membrane protein [Chitinophagaceae bacterium]
MNNPVYYQLQIVNENASFGDGLILNIESDNAGIDTVKTFTHKAFSDSLIAHGFDDLSKIAQLKWRVVATSGNFNLPSNYSNILYIVREVKMYLVGSFQTPTQWDPPTAIRMIPDTRAGLLNNMFYAYIFMPAGAQFKFLQGQAWGLPDYGDAGGGSLSNGGNNFNIAVAGFYRISMNKATLKYDIRAGRMGFVGAAVNNVGWNPGAVFPTAAMGAQGTNKFLGVHDFTAGEWKMIDSDAWDNGSQLPDETRSYSSAGPSGSKLNVNSGNMPNINSAGRYRIIWNGTDVKNVQYELMPADEMRIVGDGIQGVPNWDPGASPQLAYQGNGQWKIICTLIAGKQYKFLAGNAWGAFDYESAGGGKIKYDGGDNFSTPGVTGLYTVTLDEVNGTITVM